MASSVDRPRLILGLKVRRLRLERGFTLAQLAARAGVSVSYLSEIEKGRKYPKPEKIVELSNALGVAFDELVSLQVSEELSALKQAIGSPLLREFPFRLFGLQGEDLIRLVESDAEKAGALIHALLEVGATYDVDLEEFLLSALRAYQQMNGNYFDEIEREATQFRSESGLKPGEPVSASFLQEWLESQYQYELDFERLNETDPLAGFRSVLVPGPKPQFLVNPRLLPSQRAFVLAREIGHCRLDLRERALTSSWIEVESFDQVLNNFKASYFAGAVLLDRASVEADLEALFRAPEWQPATLIACFRRFDTTPETYFTRMTQLVPRLFGADEIFFLRFSSRAESDEFQLTKYLNMSTLPLTRGLGLREHYCRRWPSMKLSETLPSGRDPAILIQRSRFLSSGEEFFVLSTLRPLALDRSRSSSVTLGIKIDENTETTFPFLADPDLPVVDVNLTCERCPLTDDECRDRAAPAVFVERSDVRAARRRALEQLQLGDGHL